MTILHFARSCRPAAFAFLAATAAAACTVLNAVDGLTPEVDAGTPDAEIDAARDAGSDVGTDAPAAQGIIVVGGVVQMDGEAPAVLTALDPVTGLELPRAREKLLVASVQYDGLRDIWYVFETKGATHFSTPSDPVFLHVRTLDAQTGAWEELQSVQVPTIVANTHVAVLRERLVYVGYRSDADGSVGQALVVVDTSKPTEPAVVGRPTPLAREPIGIIGTRGSTSPGGNVTLVYQSLEGAEADADAGTCGGGGGGDAGIACLELQRVLVAAEGIVSVGPPKAIAQFVGSPAFGSYLGKGTPVDYVGVIRAPPNGLLQGYLPSNGAPIGDPITFSMNDAFLKPIAFADCLGQALVIGTNTETAVNAIPLAAGGIGDRGVMQHSGQSVHYEPFTSTVLAPFTQGGGYELTAFSLRGTASAPKLSLRQAPEWSPPRDLRPELVATRAPLPFKCP